MVAPASQLSDPPTNPFAVITLPLNEPAAVLATILAEVWSFASAFIPSSRSAFRLATLVEDDTMNGDTLLPDEAVDLNL